MPLPDAEVLAVQWVKSNSALNVLLSGRVATRLPQGATFPFLRVYRAGGSPDNSEAPLDHAVMQFDSFGSDGDTSPAYAEASLVARTLAEEAKEFRGTVTTYGTILGMTVINGPRRIEEPETGYARYLVELMMMTRE